MQWEAMARALQVVKGWLAQEDISAILIASPDVVKTLVAVEYALCFIAPEAHTSVLYRYGSRSGFLYKLGWVITIAPNLEDATLYLANEISSVNHPRRLVLLDPVLPERLFELFRNRLRQFPELSEWVVGRIRPHEMNRLRVNMGLPAILPR